MNTTNIWAAVRMILLVVGVGFFILGLLKEDPQIFWLGTLIFMASFAALAYATIAQNQDDESHPQH
ncbi:MAG: hypothetical protein GY906_33600 [bacterium]|nr:hypothetical protein [bacterium]